MTFWTGMHVSLLGRASHLCLAFLLALMPGQLLAQDQSPASEQTFPHLENLAIFIDDGERAVQFFTDALGFELVLSGEREITDPANALRFPVGTKYSIYGVATPDGSLRIGLFDLKGDVIPKVAYRTGEMPWVGQSLILLKTDRIREVYAKTVELGYPVYGHVDRGEGERVRGQIFIEGPGNMRVEVVQIDESIPLQPASE